LFRQSINRIGREPEYEVNGLGLYRQSVNRIGREPEYGFKELALFLQSLNRIGREPEYGFNELEEGQHSITKTRYYRHNCRKRSQDYNHFRGDDY
jgi:hypothetical protein